MPGRVDSMVITMTAVTSWVTARCLESRYNPSSNCHPGGMVVESTMTGRL